MRRFVGGLSKKKSKDILLNDKPVNKKILAGFLMLQINRKFSFLKLSN